MPVIFRSPLLLILIAFPKADREGSKDMSGEDCSEMTK